MQFGLMQNMTMHQAAIGPLYSDPLFSCTEVARYKRPNWKEANAGGFEDWKQIGPVNCNKPLNYIGAP